MDNDSTGSTDLNTKYQWEYLRRNEKYQADYTRLLNECGELENHDWGVKGPPSSPEILADRFCSKWRISEPVDFKLDRIPLGVEFYPAHFYLGVFSKADFDFGLDFDPPILAGKSFTEKKFLTIVIDLEAYVHPQKNGTGHDISAKIGALQRKHFPRTLKPRLGSADLDRSLRAYDLHKDGRPLAKIAAELGFSGKNGTNSAKQLVCTARKHISQAPNLPFRIK